MEDGVLSRGTSLDRELHLNKKAHCVADRWIIGQTRAGDLGTELENQLGLE